MEYYHDLHKSMQSWYETLNIKEEKPELSPTLCRKGKNKKNKISNVQVYNWLKTISNKCDGYGLLHYIVQNKKEETTIQNDLSVVLNNVPNAAKLALKVLQGYKFSNLASYGLAF